MLTSERVEIEEQSTARDTTNLVDHISDDELLQHALGMVQREDELAPIEEHLLVCRDCLAKIRKLESQVNEHREDP